MAKSSKNENTKKYAIDLSRVFFVCHIIVLFLFPFQLNAMVENDSMLVHDSAIVHDSAFTQDSTIVHDSTVVQNSSEEMPADTTEEERPLWLEVLIWPFSNIIQPALSAAIYPVSTPLKYAFKNRVIDKGVNLISFGKEKNIFIYPTFDLTPGASTHMGVVYRHRHLFLKSDYFVFNFSLYANSDWRSSIRYSKDKLFNTKLLFGTRLSFDANRNSSFYIPMTYEAFTQTDSSISFESRLTHPLPNTNNWGATILFNARFVNTDLPDVNDTILTYHPTYYVKDRGVYQDYNEKRVQFSLQFDNTDLPFVPSKGSRVIWNIGYSWVSNYSDLDLELPWRKEKNHDYYYLEFIYQHYFLLGTSPQYLLSVSEAREIRRKYADFSWDESVRLWNPQKMKDLLLDRKVIALQFRYRNMFEMQKGGAPFQAFPTLNSRYPLRGYTSSLVAPALAGLSLEYRWPVDRYIDGVFFNEYALFSDKFYSWKSENLRNSWGLGVRVRSPDMFFFRGQIGFHGLHGISLIITISPEFN